MFIPLLLFLFLALILIAVLVAGVATIMAVARHAQFERPLAKMPEAQYAADANRLVNEIKDALKACPIPYEQKTALLRQVRVVPGNVNRALHKLHRLRRIKKIAKRAEDAANAPDVLSDIAEIERGIINELRRTHETLLAVPVTLMKVDVARGGRNLDRIIAELSETNRRLNDLADSYGEVRARQNLSYP